MYAVIGIWELDTSRQDEQRATLEQIVDGVRGAQGLVTGYWTATDDRTRSSTVILFATKAAAEEFAEAVRSRFPQRAAAGVSNVSLDVEKVVATT